MVNKWRKQSGEQDKEKAETLTSEQKTDGLNMVASQSDPHDERQDAYDPVSDQGLSDSNEQGEHERAPR
jgi:hypothetical protein